MIANLHSRENPGLHSGVLFFCPFKSGSGFMLDKLQFMKCCQKNCSLDAAFLMMWPGQANKPVCEHHAEWAREIAEAMGFTLQFTPLEKEIRDVRSCEE